MRFPDDKPSRTAVLNLLVSSVSSCKNFLSAIRHSFVIRHSSFVILMLATASAWAGGILQIRNGYFWDPQTQDYFIPRGIAYQSFNPPVGADQTFPQVEYDFLEFKKMRANSVRCEFVWSQLETNQDVFDWSKPDFLVQKAEELGLRLFVLIGFQYAPPWFPEAWKAVNDIGSNSVVLAYENPFARARYSNYIAQVTRRYRNSSAIGGWILGNEYAYFDLWEPARRYLGYDDYSQSNYIAYLVNKYTNNIAALNYAWQASFTSFSQIRMPHNFPADRDSRYWHDLLQWRKQSIGDYVALGSIAARDADPNHLRTYSMIGGMFGEADAHYTCEDARTIVSRCAAAGAPLDFWAINNYAIASLDSELRSADYGLRHHQAASGLPVLISETGHTSTENLHAGTGPRQPPAVPSQMWEMLISGAIGTHIFTWNDRDMFAGGWFGREQGFGIVQQNRLGKAVVYSNVVEMFRRMEQLNLPNLLAGSTQPSADIQFFWGTSSDIGWPRANQENIRIWSTLKRLGYQPLIINEEKFDRGDWRTARALLLSRCFQMEPRHLGALVSNVIPAGIHLHANADLPGQRNAYRRANTNWASHMNYLFGLDVTNAFPGWEGGATNTDNMFQLLNFTGAQAIGPLTNGYTDFVGSWKIWHGLRATHGVTAVTHRGWNGTQSPLPALQLHTIGAARTAFNSWSIGDVSDWSGQAMPHSWDIRYDWLRAIYRAHFGMPPAVDLSGPGSQYVIPDWRVCRNGSVLLSLLNGHTNTASITLTAHALLDGKMVENVTAGGIIETNSDGLLQLTISGDQYLLLYAYTRAGGVDASLLNPSPNKFWFQAAPGAVWPNGPGCPVTIGYEVESNVNLVVSFERVMLPNKIYCQSAPVSLSGKGSQTVQMLIPDADLNDIDYLSSLEGGQYTFHAWLEKAGLRLHDIYLPVRLLWGVRPLSLPPTVVSGNTYPVTVAWQELPSYEPAEGGLPLNRAALWQTYMAQSQYYDVVLELRTNGQAVASDHFLTCTGSDNHTFSIRVPTGVTGPYTWYAYLRPAPETTPAFFDGFENRGPGANPNYLNPWITYVYAAVPGTAAYLDSGVQASGRDSCQSAFIVVTNPPTSGDYAGFGMVYTFPKEWALPSDLQQWTNYILSFDFKENAALACNLELQLNDAVGGQLHFTKNYSPGPDQWDTIRAPLSQFVITDYAPFNGAFNLTRVQSMVVNIQMLQKPAMYVASVDNVRFDAPLKAPPSGPTQDYIDSFEDRLRGADPAYTSPWSGYVYAESNNANFLAQGIHAEASDGYQSAFMAVQNPAYPGAYSGFGLYYNFTNTWALPTNRSQWSNYLFSFDFKEDETNRCQFELQIKSAQSEWIEFTKIYSPGSGWSSIRASLDQFTQPPGAGTFDPNHVTTLALNVRMLQTNSLYLASFDRVQFIGPRNPLPPETAYGIYTSANDSRMDSDRDGIPDVYETGTGIYVGPTNTGTNPYLADSDGDGLTDGQELIAGTDPNASGDVLRISTIQQVSGNQVVLTWPAKTNRIYGIEYFDDGMRTNPIFVPLDALTNLVTPTNGALHAVDTNALSPSRFYRVKVFKP